MNNKFTGDFETTTDIFDCRVWAWALCEIGNPDNFIYGTDLDSFMEYCEHAPKNLKIWFHNLKFDGTFIINWLLDNGFEVKTEKAYVSKFLDDKNVLVQSVAISNPLLHQSFLTEYMVLLTFVQL